MRKPVKILAAVFYILLSSLPTFTTAAALSSSDTQSLYNDTVWYDPNSSVAGGNPCGDTGGTVSANLPNTVPEPYNTLFTQVADKMNINAQFLAAIFLTENGNTWKPFDTQWASSPAGAKGPFQFMPGTWDSYKTDGNNDGVTDINNMYDASYSAAKLLYSYNVRPNTPLGSLDTPFKRNTLLQVSASYNWGSGNVQMHTTDSSGITGDGSVPTETQNYIKNVNALITSGFTKSGNPNYGDPSSGSGNLAGKPGVSTDCSGGVVSGSIVQTALNLAWDTIGHGKDEADAKPSYQAAMPKYNGSTGDDEWSDCGVFVATVMIASGADPNYVKRGTSLQMDYIKSHPEKYSIFYDINSTSQLQPGDILINTQHTYLYIGNQKSASQSGLTYNAVAASLHGHVPQVTSTYFDLGGEHFWVVRLK